MEGYVCIGLERMNNNHNFTYSERVTLEHHLNLNIGGSAIKLAKLLNKSRSTIYYEIRKFMTINKSKAELFNNNSKPEMYCDTLKHFPFVCNGCAKTLCVHRSRIYKAYDAQIRANKLLRNSRVNKAKREEVIHVLNRSVCPLIKDGVSIHVAKESVNNCNLSESTIRRYIENGLVNAKRIDLPRAVKFKAKKEYNYKIKPLDANILYGRTYDDYKLYIDAYPNSKILQLDSVIGKANDKRAILTIYFKNSKLQLGFMYHRKSASTVEILKKLYKLGLDNGYKLFDVVLADNGSEFKNLYKLEKDEEGNNICKVFYCDPYRSCQKAECEKNHGFFRRIWPKGRSMNKFNQETVNEIFSHINSYPRNSLKNKSPYELFCLEYTSIILTSLNIMKIEVKDIKLIDYKRWGNYEH